MKKSFRKNGVNVAVCIFQEVKDGECIFEWDSTDYPELYAISREGNDYNNTTCTWVRAGLPHFCLTAFTSSLKLVLFIFVSQTIDINLPCALVIKFSFPKIGRAHV